MRHGIILHIFLLITFVWSGCAPININKVKNTLYSSFKTISPENEKFQSVVLRDDITFDVSVTEKGLLVHKRVHRIYRIKRDRKFKVVLNLENGEALSHIAARTINRDVKDNLLTHNAAEGPDRVIDLKMKDIFIRKYRDNTSEKNEASKKITFSYPGIKENSMVEYIYESERLITRRPYMLYKSIATRENRPVVSYHRSISLPSGIIDGTGKWSFDHTVIKPDIIKKDSDTEKGKVRYTWSAMNLEPRYSEPHAPDIAETNPGIRFVIGKWNSPQTMSEELYNSIYKYHRITPLIKETAAKITAGKSSDSEKIAALVHFVQNMLPGKYREYKHTIAAYNPTSVLKRQYGNEKDSVSLLISLLHASGFTDAKPVLAAKCGQPDLPLHLKLNSLSNLIRLQHKGVEYWIQPWSRKRTFDDISPIFFSMPALILSPDGDGEEAIIPEPEKYRHGHDYELSLEISPDFNSDMKSTVTWHGDNVSVNRYELANASQQEKHAFAANLLKHRYYNSSITDSPGISDISHSDTDSIEDTFSFSFTAKPPLLIKRPWSETYDLDIMPLNIGYSKGSDTLFEKTRSDPITWETPYASHIRLTITYPEEKLETVSVPEDQSISFFDGKLSFSSKITTYPGKIVLETSYKRNIYKVEPRHYDKLRQYFSRIAETLNRNIIFKKPGATKKPAESKIEKDRHIKKSAYKATSKTKQSEKAPGIKKEISTVEIQPGSQLKTTYPLKWVSTGLFSITAVTAGTGIAFLIKSARKNDSYNNMMHIDKLKEYTETGGTVAEYTAKAETYREDSEKYRKLGWVSIGTAAASAVTGGLLFLFRKDVSVKETGIVSFSTDGKGMFITYGREF